MKLLGVPIGTNNYDRNGIVCILFTRIKFVCDPCSLSDWVYCILISNIVSLGGLQDHFRQNLMRYHTWSFHKTFFVLRWK